ncbi:MAG: ADP-ribosylglycohydrolase family protein [Saonia sp.]
MKKLLEYPSYNDKIRGGWVGKCAGGILGAPIEGYKRFNTIKLNDKLFENNFANDDLDLQLLWLDMVLKKGTHIRENDFKEHWANHVAFPWNEYGIATRNIRLGLDNPDSGSHNNGYWKYSMGSPIRSEIWGMLCAGNPKMAAQYAHMDSTLDHEGFSIAAEQFLSACAALAFVENDIHVVLKKGLAYIPKNSACSTLITSVLQWNDRYGPEITAGKIKSLYGDADFTSAPMNIGFTVLSLLTSKGNLDHLSTALHYGHDSDCIVATAGALLGIIVGYDAMPEIWKERVGDEILVSPEIHGISCPKSIADLTEMVCKAAGPFLELNADFVVRNYPFQETPFENREKYRLNTGILDYPNINSGKNGLVRVAVENLTDKPLELRLLMTSDFFENQSEKIIIPAKEKYPLEFVLLLTDHTVPVAPSLKYTIHVEGSGTKVYERGVPNYGKWLLLGPFMQDDSNLIAMDPHYPDHGMSSLPSVRYMNHDLQRPATEFIKPETPSLLLKQSDLDRSAFGVQTICPDTMEMDMADYFYGRGERSLYVYTQIDCKESLKKWLCLGHSNYCTAWLNHKKLHETKLARRRWPGTETVELMLKEGRNELLLRFDIVNDDFLVNIGLKEHKEKHPHQSQWDTELLFNVQDLQND